MSTKEKTVAPQYAVTVPLIQVASSPPFAGPNSAPVRHFVEGDILPDWVSPDELERLTNGGFIRAISRVA